MFPGDLHRPPGVRVAVIPLPEVQAAAIRLPGVHRLPGVQAVVTALPGVRVVPPGAQ